MRALPIQVRRAALTIIGRGGRCAGRQEGSGGCYEDMHVGFWASRAPMDVT